MNIIYNFNPADYAGIDIEVIPADVPVARDTLPPECKITEPVDCERAHQATIDLCRGGR